MIASFERLSGAGAQQQPPIIPFMMLAEVKHVQQRPGVRVKRAASDEAGVPVILDKAQDRTLIGQAVVHKVFLGVRRDHQQRLARAEAGNALKAKTRARSVILLYLGGGLSHHDSFDPKPDAPAEVRGKYTTIGTSVPGLRVTEMVPRMATCTCGARRRWGSIVAKYCTS